MRLNRRFRKIVIWVYENYDPTFKSEIFFNNLASRAFRRFIFIFRIIKNCKNLLGDVEISNVVFLNVYWTKPISSEWLSRTVSNPLEVDMSL